MTETCAQQVVSTMLSRCVLAPVRVSVKIHQPRSERRTRERSLRRDTRNASLQLAPADVAAITGLRQMFVFMGVIFSVSAVTAILNRSADPDLAQAHVLWAVAALLVLIMVPLVFRVPEHKGSW